MEMKENEMTTYVGVAFIVLLIVIVVSIKGCVERDFHNTHLEKMKNLQIELEKVKCNKNKRK